MVEQKKILITGVNGLVGYRLSEYLREMTSWSVIGTSRKKGPMVDCIADLTKKVDVERIKKSIQPDVIIHTAAIVGANECDKYPEICYTTNVDATANLCEIFSNSYFIYFSTCAVYDTPTGRCNELCETSASNYYVQTKLEAEEYVKKMNNHVILRPSVIFGFVDHHKNNNYFMQLLEIIRSKRVMYSPRDQFFNPIYVDTVVDILVKIIESDVQGIYNIGSTEVISKYEFNSLLMEIFDLDRNYIEGVTSEFFSVKRPQMGTISSEKIQRDLPYHIPTLIEMFERLHSTSKEKIEAYLISS